MKVCESCCAQGYHERTYQGRLVKVLCGACLGVGSICLGPEGEARWRAQRAAAIDRGSREGWLEEVWAGEPGNARKVLQRVGANALTRSA